MFGKKDPYRNRKIAAIIVLLLFLGSSLAIAIIDAISFGVNDNEEMKLPDKISYAEPSSRTKDVLVSQGYMLVRYEYPENCSECNNTIQEVGQFLEDKPDTYLFIVNGANETIEFESYRGKQIVAAGNSSAYLDSYCDLTFYKYETCIFRKI